MRRCKDCKAHPYIPGAAPRGCEKIARRSRNPSPPPVPPRRDPPPVREPMAKIYWPTARTLADILRGFRRVLQAARDCKACEPRRTERKLKERRKKYVYFEKTTGNKRKHRATRRSKAKRHRGVKRSRRNPEVPTAKRIDRVGSFFLLASCTSIRLACSSGTLHVGYMLFHVSLTSPERFIDV